MSVRKKSVTWHKPPTSKIEIYETQLPDSPKPTSLAPTGTARLTSNRERIAYYQSMERFCMPREAAKRFIYTILHCNFPGIIMDDDAIIYIHTELEKFIIDYISAAKLIAEHAKHKKIDIEDIYVTIGILRLLTSYSINIDESSYDDTAEETIGIPTPSMRRLTFKAGATFTTPGAANILRIIAKLHFTHIFQLAIDNMLTTSRKSLCIDDFN